MTRSHVLVVAAVVCLTAGPVAAQERLTAAQLIARVRENEARYDDLEVRVVEKTRHTAFDGGAPKSVDSHARVRSVRQKGMSRVESETGRDEDTLPTSRFRAVFDGATARINRDGEVTTLPRGVRYDEGVFQPHTLALNQYVPLSVWLGGGPELRNHPGVKTSWSNADVRSRPAGREKVRGIDCEKVVCECFAPDGKRGTEVVKTVTLWLSPAHNFIPVREETAHAGTPRAFQNTTDCDDFREARPGVWLPYQAVVTRYDRLADNRVKLQTRTITVESVRLDPNYPLAVFRDVALPVPPR